MASSDAAPSLFKQRQMAARAAAVQHPGVLRISTPASCGRTRARTVMTRRSLTQVSLCQRASLESGEGRARHSAAQASLPPRDTMAENLHKGLVRIETTHQGRRMLATRSVAAGTELFSEDPILFVETQMRDVVSVTRAAFAAFVKKSDDEKTRILSFHVPAEDLDSADQLKLAAEEPDTPSLSVQEKEVFVRLGLVMKANSAVAQQPTEDLVNSQMMGLGLYELGCRANHSCNPNACWLDAAGSGGRRLFRALVAIAAGEEITNDYLSESAQLLPTAARQKKLMATKTFLCGCTRCAAECDDVRRFRCHTRVPAGDQSVNKPPLSRSSSSTSSASSSSSSSSSSFSSAPSNQLREACKGWHLAHNPSTDRLDYLIASTPCPATGLAPCSACGAQPSPAATAECLRLEQIYAQELDKINARIDAAVDDWVSSGEGAQRDEAAVIVRQASDLLSSLSRDVYLHQHHYLVGQAGHMRWEVLLGVPGREGDRDSSLRYFLDAFRASMRPGVASITEGLKCVQLAESSLAAQPTEAQQLLRAAVAQFSVVCGPQHPFTMGAEHRLRSLYVAGRRIRVEGLVKAAQYNGCCGRVKRIVDGVRVCVVLEEGLTGGGEGIKELSIKFVNACIV